MPEQFENGRKLDGKNSLQDFDAKKVCLHPKNRSASLQKRLKFSVPVIVPFSKSTVFKICRQKMCRFLVNGRPIRRIFHRFQMCWHCVNAVQNKQRKEIIIAGVAARKM